MGIFQKKKAAALLTALLWLTPAGQALAMSEELVPMGNTVGIQLKLDGVMVVALSEVETAEGKKTPAADAGLLVGDIITAMDDRTLDTAADFVTAVSALDGAPVAVTVRRQDKSVRFTVLPALNTAGSYQLGLWLRDGVTGIGTLTYVDPETGAYGALGHGINDVDTGALFPLGNGALTSAEIVDVIRGGSGTPGELCGKLHDDRVGSIEGNADCGVFGVYEQMPEGTALPVGAEEEIALGPASILANVEGTAVREYDVEICRVYHDPADSRTMMLHITDPALLEATGGIVQGMSGSPILQNGKLVGAVTHVLLSDPARGYGISIERMLRAAEESAQAA